MNVCVVSGHVLNNGIVRGKDKKILVFTVITQQQNGDGEPTVSHVPCVLFNPSAELEQLLTTQGKGMSIEFQGRVNARFENNGQPRSNAEVVVFNKSLRLGEATMPDRS